MSDVVHLRLVDGVRFVVKASYEEFKKSYAVALRDRVLLDIENADGKLRSVNPLQVVYFAEESDEA